MKKYQDILKYIKGHYPPKSMGLENLLKPLHINDIILPNRIVFPAFQANYATPEGFVTERLLHLYGKIASGGSSLIIAGCMVVSDEGTPNTNAIKTSDDKHISGLKELFSIIKEKGAVAGAQLMLMSTDLPE